MTVLVFAVSAALVLVGAIAVLWGAPIIQLERGWAEVIAGTVAVSGGAVTFGLGVVLLRLQSLGDALLAGARPASPMPLAIRDEDFTVLRPTRSVEDALVVTASTAKEAAEPLPTAPRTEPAEALGHWPPESEPAGAVLADAGHAGTPTSEPKNARNRTHEQQDTPRIADSRAPEPEIAARRLPSPPDLAASDPEVPRSSATSSSRDWLSRPLTRSRPSRTSAPEPPPLFATASEGDQLDKQYLDSSSTRPNQARSGRAELPPATRGGDAPSGLFTEPPREGITVIGRYQAGASSYTMYSDGAIDVETQGGDIHRFGSMDDLKAFIARQERALS